MPPISTRPVDSSDSNSTTKRRSPSGSSGKQKATPQSGTNAKREIRSLCFSPRPVVLCGLPLRPFFRLQVIQSSGAIEARIGSCLFLAILAVRQKRQTVQFPYRRGTDGSLRPCERIFGAMIFFGAEAGRQPRVYFSDRALASYARLGFGKRETPRSIRCQMSVRTNRPELRVPSGSHLPFGAHRSRSREGLTWSPGLLDLLCGCRTDAS
jgi:hypothetical protein